MSNANQAKLQEKIDFLQKEAEVYKRQSYDQADLLLDLVPSLSRLGFAANAEVMDAAFELARDVTKNSQDVDAIRVVADNYLSVYKKAKDADTLKPHDENWRSGLAEVVGDLPIDAELRRRSCRKLLEGIALAEAFQPIADALQEIDTDSALSDSTCERLAAMISALPLQDSKQLQANKLSSRLRLKPLPVQELEQILDELASLLGCALQSTSKRDQQMQSLVTQMSGELGAVEAFLSALNQRDDAALTEAIAAQSEIGDQSQQINSVFESDDPLQDIKTQVLSRAQSIRVRMDRFVEEAKQQREQSSQDAKGLSERLAAMESELRNTQKKLLESQEAANRDFLTGLHNRLYFQKTMLECLDLAKTGEKLCCIIWDVDFFKKVNDNYGHMVGDRVLRKISALLKESVEERDTAARLGGEEFVTVILNRETSEVMQWADNLRQAVAAMTHDAETETIKVSVSCGIAAYQHGDSEVSILARADKALYSAKEQGRNRCLLAA